MYTTSSMRHSVYESDLCQHVTSVEKNKHVLHVLRVRSCSCNIFVFVSTLTADTVLDIVLLSVRHVIALAYDNSTAPTKIIILQGPLHKKVGLSFG